MSIFVEFYRPTAIVEKKKKRNERRKKNRLTCIALRGAKFRYPSAIASDFIYNADGNHVSFLLCNIILSPITFNV